MNNSDNKSTGFYVGDKPKSPQGQKSANENSEARITTKQENQPSTPAPRSYAYEE